MDTSIENLSNAHPYHAAENYLVTHCQWLMAQGVPTPVSGDRTTLVRWEAATA